MAKDPRRERSYQRNTHTRSHVTISDSIAVLMLAILLGGLLNFYNPELFGGQSNPTLTYRLVPSTGQKSSLLSPILKSVLAIVGESSGWQPRNCRMLNDGTAHTKESPEIDSLKTWLSEGGAIFQKVNTGQFLNPLYLDDESGEPKALRGMLATEDVKSGDLLLKIPSGMTISRYTSPCTT